jgi:hypothetical protein
MLNARHVRSTCPFAATLFLSLLGLTLMLPCQAQLPTGVVPITSEPNHKLKYENDRVRMIEASVPNGKTTLYHEHQYDGFFVFFRSKGFASEPFHGKRVVTDLPVGAVVFIPAANAPYIHRVNAGRDQDALVSVVELKAPSSVPTNAAELRFPPFETVLENARGRVYRLKLNPGESSDRFTRPAGTAIFAISSGQISEQAEGKPKSLLTLEPGQFRWADTEEKLTVTDEGQTSVELVEIEVF